MLRVMRQLDPTNKKTKTMKMTKTCAHKKTITCAYIKTMAVKMTIAISKTTKGKDKKYHPDDLDVRDLHG